MANDEATVRRPGLLSIGELARSTGVADTALRYYDQIGLVRPVARVSGRRRYERSAVQEVGLVCLLREVGFSLTDIGAFLDADQRSRRDELIDHNLEELAARQQRLATVRDVLQHGRLCSSEDPAECTIMGPLIQSLQSGLSLAASHEGAHATHHK
jgi:DNA-binding transcriptional MerR regulator